MEGVSYEAASLAGHLKLGRLIILYDSNDISLDGEFAFSFSEDIKQRFESCGWQYLFVKDGNDIEAIEKAINEAKEDETHPTIIEIKTVIGYGAPTIQGKSDAHSDPIGTEEIKRAKAFYKWNYEEDFYVPEEVYDDFSIIKENGAKKEQEWNQLLERYANEYPELANELKRVIAGELPEGWIRNYQHLKWESP